MMNKYYFTFGSEGHPYKGGWVVVEAQTVVQAATLFRMVFPDKYDGILNCSDYYTEEAFKRTAMYEKNSNYGSGCHGVISIKIEFNENQENKKTAELALNSGQ